MPFKSTTFLTFDIINVEKCALQCCKKETNVFKTILFVNSDKVKKKDNWINYVTAFESAESSQPQTYVITSRQRLLYGITGA